jgi:voltage-dependent potassium channel beta subunit
MGSAIRKFNWKRNDIVISTKLNWGGAFGSNPVNNYGLSRKHIIEGMAGSLERLGLKYVDLIYAHRPDRHTPMEETVRAFNYLINSGQALYWGTSEWSADEITRAMEISARLGLIAPIMEQPEYNMLKRGRVENEYFLLYREYGLGLTIFSPLKMGLLTGKYDDGVPQDSRLAVSKDGYAQSVAKSVGDEAWQKNIEKVKKLKTIAEKLGTNRVLLAYAWVLKNPNVSSAITGASKPEQVIESVKALEIIPKLTDEVMEEIEAVLENKPDTWTMRFT